MFFFVFPVFVVDQYKTKKSVYVLYCFGTPHPYKKIETHISILYCEQNKCVPLRVFLREKNDKETWEWT